jgi:hypothetical protein|tara:strand:+ start:381 stop:578 length:198 start_codon:yes stop_codon:yes gene_type:complete
MANVFVVIKNSNRVVFRAEARSDALAEAATMSAAHPRASFEVAKVFKKLYTTRSVVVNTPVQEDY